MRQWLVRLSWVCTVLAALILTLMSPFLLLIIMKVSPVDWVLVGDAGQAYGFASAALSGMAFMAVAYSLVAQQKESRVMRHEAQRLMHMELLRMAIENPDLLAAGAPELLDAGAEYARQHLYINLLVQYWRMNFVGTKVAYPESVSGAARALFKGEAGRRYWGHIRTHALDRWGLDGPRDREFVRLIDAAYEQAISDPRAATDSTPHRRAEAENSTVVGHTLRGLAAGALMTFLVMSRVRKR